MDVIRAFIDHHHEALAAGSAILTIIGLVCIVAGMAMPYTPEDE